AVGGWSGSGKTTVARAIAPAIGPAPGAVLLRSDTVRKAMAGVAETERLPEHAYTRESSARVYAALRDRAAATLAAGHAALVDAVHGSEEEREAIAAVARAAGIAFLGLWLDLPQADAARRVTGRRGDASDAD